MDMDMKFFRKLPVPKDLKEQFPADERIVKIKQERDPEIRRIFEGKSDKLLLIIGPCSALLCITEYNRQLWIINIKKS